MPKLPSAPTRSARNVGTAATSIQMTSGEASPFLAKMLSAFLDTRHNHPAKPKANSKLHFIMGRSHRSSKSFMLDLSEALFVTTRTATHHTARSETRKAAYLIRSGHVSEQHGLKGLTAIKIAFHYQ